MSIFDTFTLPAPRPVCPECGGGYGKRGGEPGEVVKPHDRQDQAMVVGIGNPCPGAGQRTIAAEAFISLNDRLRAERRKANGGEYVGRCGLRPGRHEVAFVADKVDPNTGYEYHECSVCGEIWGRA